MNAAITGAWGKQRSRISLNHEIPPGSAAAAALAREENKPADEAQAASDDAGPSDKRDTVSYTHLTLPTTPYV